MGPSQAIFEFHTSDRLELTKADLAATKKPVELQKPRAEGRADGAEHNLLKLRFPELEEALS